MVETSSQSAEFRNAEKSASAFRTISEVSNELDVPQHVLRFWESKFSQIKPLKRGGGRRYYRPEDIGLLCGIRNLLYHDGYTIKGVQRLLREGGAKSIIHRDERKLAPQGPRSGSPSAIPPDPAGRALPSPGAGERDAAMAAATGLSARVRADLEQVLSELEGLRDLLRGSKS